MWFLKYCNGLQTPKENSTRKRRRKEKEGDPEEGATTDAYASKAKLSMDTK